MGIGEYVFQEVVCDFCNGDFTDSEEQGGSLVGSYALCPECAKKMKKADQRAREGQTFADFVREVRYNTMKNYHEQNRNIEG